LERFLKTLSSINTISRRLQNIEGPQHALIEHLNTLHSQAQQLTKSTEDELKALTPQIDQQLEKVKKY
jgi:sugar-specific transcriptional regulator TrmB